jgi:cellulose synthase/poly-beta-1,6-N-acetylglucosamine synthase-like glycosyltransferase
MIDILLIVFLLLTWFYVVVNILLAVGVWRTPSYANPTSPLVSVIVAARNEEQQIRDLLEHLAAQDYPRFEIIVVDDRSTDGTGRILRHAGTRFPTLKIITVTDTSGDMPAKKNALEQAIKASKGEILCFTDADCLPQVTWVRSLVRCFDEQTGLVAGYSPYQVEAAEQPDSLFLDFVRFEELRGAIWSAGSIRWGLGWLCTGRNLAYRRKVWDEVEGFEKIKHSISGDDDLFLQLVRRTTRWKIRYVRDSENHVPTTPPATLTAFLNQRIRHFSAGKYFTRPMKVFFATYHGANFLLYAGFFAGLFSRSPLLVATFLAKVAADYILILAGRKIEKRMSYFLASPLMEFLYLCYNVIIGPLGLKGSFRWKP